MTLPTRTACLLAATAALVSWAAAPPAARATTTCTYAPTGKLVEVLMPAADDRARLQVEAGVILVLDAADQPLACSGGTPTVTNTSVITVVAGGFSGNGVTIDGPASFAPGADTVGENAGTPEIEIFVNLKDGPGSSLGIGGDSAGGSVLLGTGGINPNAATNEVAPDADIFPLGVTFRSLSGGDGSDTLSAQGGAGTGAAFADEVGLSGGAGDDRLVGGEGSDAISGDEGSDALLGMGGSDTFHPNAFFESSGGFDSVQGGEGIDLVTYGQFAFGVSVDLALPGPQGGQGNSFGDSFTEVENVNGTEGADVLRGDAGPNRLTGGPSDDVLEGRGGPDILFAGDGDDALDVRDGGPDSANCGLDEDTVMLFGQPPGAGDDTPPAPPAQPAAPLTPLPGPPQNVAPVLTGLRVAPAAFPALARRGGRGAARGARVSYVLSEAATTTFTVQRAVPGRRAGRACVRPTRGNRRARRCTRWIAQRGSVTRAGRPGANSFRFTGRLDRRALAVGSYRLVAQARDSGGQRSRTVRRGFRIVR
jgi:hypothetical protein